MSKPGRNDPCPCGSGKKYKKCCEKKLFKGKFTAQKIETPKQIQGNIFSSIFQSNIQSANATLDKEKKAKPIRKKEEKSKNQDNDSSKNS